MWAEEQIDSQRSFTPLKKKGSGTGCKVRGGFVKTVNQVAGT